MYLFIFKSFVIQRLYTTDVMDPWAARHLKTLQKHLSRGNYLLYFYFYFYIYSSSPWTGARAPAAVDFRPGAGGRGSSGFMNHGLTERADASTWRRSLKTRPGLDGKRRTANFMSWPSFYRFRPPSHRSWIKPPSSGWRRATCGWEPWSPKVTGWAASNSWAGFCNNKLHTRSIGIRVNRVLQTIKNRQNCRSYKTKN